MEVSREEFWNLLDRGSLGCIIGCVDNRYLAISFGRPEGRVGGCVARRRPDVHIATTPWQASVLGLRVVADRPVSVPMPASGLRRGRPVFVVLPTAGEPSLVARRERKTKQSQFGLCGLLVSI